MYQKHCPGCFENKQSLAICPSCGYDESAGRSPLFLPHGILLAETYRVGRVLGQPGGFGVTYLAWDVHLQNRVAIKEYLPRDIASRSAESLALQVHAPEQTANFEFGLEQTLTEARTLAKFDHPNIVRVRKFFRAYGTAYLVMDYYDGRSLGDYLSTLDQPVEPKTAAQLIGNVLDGLKFVHDHGVLHRDVKPHNIYLASSGRVILLDFGAARQAAGERIESASVVLSEGYAPLEQYQKHSPQGPWTDIYGAAATLFRMLKGRAPPASLDRLGDDLLKRDLDFAPEFNDVLRRALAVKPEDRYHSAAEFKRDLFHALEIVDTGAADAGRLLAEAAVRTMDWGTPAEAVTKERLPETRVADAAGTSGIRPEAWLIAAAILLGAVIISLPLWLR